MKDHLNMTRRSITEFAHHLRQEEKSPHTIRQYVREVKNLHTFVGGDRKIGKEDLLRYKRALQQKYRSNSTVNAKLCAINAYLGFMDMYHLHAKALKVQRRMFRDTSKELTREEYARLLEAAKKKGDERLFYVLQTICASGIRISELKFITVEGVRHNCAEVTAKGKTRHIFLPKQLRKELMEYCKKRGIKSGSVFVTRKGNPLDRSNVWHDMKALCELAEVKRSKVFPHNLRHLFARCFYEKQHDLVHLADILGHTSVETTRIYTLSSGEEHEEVIASLGLTA